VAESAGVVAEAASRTRQAAEDGNRAVRLSADGMDQVRSTVLGASAQVRALAESLHQVDEILALIAEIAGQTDLLALNAAIEAARVGEHGKGFAVVAGEVRRLAERVRTAAGDIGGRVDGLRQSAGLVVETMEAGTSEVERGVRLSQEAGAALDRILAAVAETQTEAQSISAAAEEIAAASQDVVNVTVQLSAIAEENAATSEEMSAGARSVSQIIAGVEEQSHTSRAATAAMAASAVQVRASVAQMVRMADRAAAMANNLHKQAAQFRF
jgi:methyl-accepting chemotaxis protein